MKYASIKESYETARKRKHHIEQEINDAYAYTFPQVSPEKIKGEKPDRSLIFDGTAPNAVNTLVSNLITFLIPHNSRWAEITVRESVMEQGVAGEQVLQLEQENKRMWEIIHDSNFYVAAAEALTDCVVSGVGCMAVELNAKSNGVTYVSVPIGQLYILENGSGVVDTVYRTHTLPARVICYNYANVPEWVKKIEEKNADEPIKLVEAMMPLEDGSSTYCVHLESDWTLLETYTTWHKPFTVFRWRKSTGDVWGDSPVRQALPDIKSLNTMVEQLLNSSEFASRGAWQTEDPTLEGKRLKPGSIIISSRNDALRPIEFSGNMQVAYNDINSLQSSVKQRLFAENLPPADNVKGVVATAITALQAQFFRLIAPAALRLEIEFLREIIINTVRLCGRNKLMGEFKVDGDPLHISVQSVVRRGLELEQVTNILQTLQLLQPFAEQAMQQVNVPELVKFIFEKTNFPSTLIQDPQQASAQAADPQQQQATEQLQALAENVLPQVMGNMEQ
ncbi:portal protein [Rhodospirillales bacterium]|nr:portal protein [Rhodospirillales bacterium]